MEKTTKKRKKSKRVKRRIGLIAVGGLSFVLTICLSVGATLAWFAGSTWASNDLYMGGPVYVEMAGRGYANGSDGNANWRGGDGQLDIVASGRGTGTADGTNSDGKGGSSNILLPGQKLLIYSQARVFSTAYDDTRDSGSFDNQSSGANTTNTSGNTPKYTDKSGNVKTATTSVLRAKFSINVEFDPYMGFNNFTDAKYAAHYPVKSANYTGETLKDGTLAASGGLAWQDALGGTSLANSKIADPDASPAVEELLGRRDAITSVATSDVDTLYIDGETGATGEALKNTPFAYSLQQLKDIKAGKDANGDKVLSIYEWKYVSKTEYDKALAPVYAEGKTSGSENITGVPAEISASQAVQYVKMEKPFDGTVNSLGGDSVNVKDNTGKSTGTGNGFYGVWVVRSGKYQESEAFYKARTEAYMKSYLEHYVDEYDRQLMLTTINSLNGLENALNTAFVNLVNQSSDNILAGNVDGFAADNMGGITYRDGVTQTEGLSPDGGYDASGKSLATSGIPATWLYVDPSIGNDTNAGASSTSVGGWWYLVESANTSATVASTLNEVVTSIDNVVRADGADDGTEPDKATGTVDSKTVDVTYHATADDVSGSKASYPGQVTYNWGAVASGDYNDPKSNGTLVRDGYTGTKTAATDKVYQVTSSDPQILTAKLFEIQPNMGEQFISSNGNVTKVVSVSFPFVNGNFELPGRELTNVFANAKITFKIQFQALQAFLPFTPSIDGLASGSPLAGTGKALNIGNAIPIYNEAFDYLTVLD